MQKFHSKIDWWVLGFVISMTGLLVQLLITMYAKGTMVEYPEHTTVYILTICLLWWPLLTTRYFVDEQKITIKSMLFSWSILRTDLLSVQPTDDSTFSPALSLKRLKIEYLKDGKKQQLLVSPRNQQGFIEELKQN